MDISNKGATIPSILKDLPFSFGVQGSTEINKYIGLGFSRRVIDTVIEKFDLDAFYNSRYREDTRKYIRNNLKINDNDDGTFTVSFTGKDRVLSAEIVNEIFQQIKALDIEISIKQASLFREFIVKRYEEVLKKLSLYEDSLKTFSENKNIIEITEQVKQTISVLTELEKKRIELSIKRDFLKATSTEENIALQNLTQQLKIIEGKINDIKNLEIYSNLPLQRIPALSLNYFRFYRQIKIHEAIIEFLAPQVENAKIEEKKTYSKLILIDNAIPSERKSGPKRLQILIGIMFASIIISIILVRLRENFRNHRLEYLKELNH